MSQPKPLPIVEVEWIDSGHHSGWINRDEWDESMRDRPYPTCRTVGYLLSRTKQAVTVVQSQSEENNEIDAVMIIPRVAVKSMRTLT